MERTLCLIKQFAVEKRYTEAIVVCLEENGFYICQRKDVYVTKDMQKKFLDLLADFPQVNSLIGDIVGNVVILELCKIAAIQELLFLLGPENPKIAQETEPLSLRSRFCGDDGQNSIYGSLSPSTFVKEVSFFFSHPPLSELPSQQYLALTVLPALNQALVELCKRRPIDPHGFIASWLETNKPTLSMGSEEYPESVIDGNCLKSDEFHQIHRQSALGPRIHPLIWNFRKSKGQAPIFGIGQSHTEGIKWICNYLFKQFNPPRIYCINTREEPVVLLNGESYSIRVEGKLNENVKYFFGISAFDLDRVENRLVEDIKDATKKNNQYIVYYQKENMINEAKEINITSVKTLRSFYDSMTLETQKIFYTRIPITDETGFSNSDFDSLLYSMQQCNKDSIILCNCQMGQGRTTTSMIAASIYWYSKYGDIQSIPQRTINKNQPDKQNGEYDAILSLLSRLTNGERIKSIVDYIIDTCDHLQNLRTTIYDTYLLTLKHSSNNENYTSNVLKATNYLKRYFMLIVFAAYVIENANLPKLDRFCTPFSQWMNNKWGLQREFQEIHIN